MFPSIIALPPSNTFLELIFSACTWFDDPLRQRLKGKRFEMAFLISVNDNLINGVVPSEKKVQEIIESIVTLFDKEGEPIGGLDEEAKNLLHPSLA